MRMRKKKNMDARWARVADYVTACPSDMRGRWRTIPVPEARLLVVELGCGKGRFLSRWAEAAPEALFVGLERVPEALLMAMEKANAQKLTNLRFISGDAAALNDYFAPGEINRLHINFCDPWPSNRRAKRRLTHRDFLLRYREALVPGGQLHFKTDNRPLFDFTQEELAAVGAVPLLVTTDWHAHEAYPGEDVPTEYEEKFSSRGIPICRLVARMN